MIFWFNTFLHIATLAANVLDHNNGHSEAHEDPYLKFDSNSGHGHLHREQLPVGYVKYPWQSPQTYPTYPGDDEGLQFFLLLVRNHVPC